MSEVRFGNKKSSCISQVVCPAVLDATTTSRVFHRTCSPRNISQFRKHARVYMCIGHTGIVKRMQNLSKAFQSFHHFRMEWLALVSHVAYTCVAVNVRVVALDGDGTIIQFLTIHSPYVIIIVDVVYRE